MSRRENQSNPIVMVLLFLLLFMVLIAGGSVFFWLQSLRAMQAKNEAERVELRAKAEAARAMQSK